MEREVSDEKIRRSRQNVSEDADFFCRTYAHAEAATEFGEEPPAKRDRPIPKITVRPLTSCR